MAVVCASDSRT